MDYSNPFGDAKSSLFDFYFFFYFCVVFQAKCPEPDAATAMAVGSDSTAVASDVTYNIGPQVIQ